MDNNKIVISLMVENESGVLSRIAGLFSRRGFNIESITAGKTVDPRMTRITVVAIGDEDALNQICSQLRKLIDVKSIEVLEPDSVRRELILIKIAATSNERQQVMSIADIFRAKIVDVSSDSMVLEMTGTENKIEAITRLLEEFGILEIARTGIVGMSRGTKSSAG
ncbi:MAG: acetolactate synthase small subunit [Lachnospiraceae bacterium]|jgi:acetolactate synthase-1/3 small subunit